MLKEITVPEGTFPGKPTRTFKCDNCGTTLREGFKMHTAKEPWAHQELEVTEVPLARLEAEDGSHGALMPNTTDESRSIGRHVPEAEARNLGLIQ